MVSKAEHPKFGSNGIEIKIHCTIQMVKKLEQQTHKLFVVRTAVLAQMSLFEK